MDIAAPTRFVPCRTTYKAEPDARSEGDAGCSGFLLEFRVYAVFDTPTA